MPLRLSLLNFALLPLLARSSPAAPPPLARPFVSSAFGSAPEPWLPLHGGGFVAPAQPSSPDPLVSYAWPRGSFNVSALQVFAVAPVAAGASAGSEARSFLNASSCVGGGGGCALRVVGAGQLIVDFGVELPGWFEFDSPDLSAGDAAALLVGISEYATTSVGGWVGGYKSGAPVRYCAAGAACTYRLETNDELYEGVRFALLTLRAAPAAPFTITALRCVAQTRPVNYTGAFSAPGDPMLERVWYTGAYTIRALMLPTYMGSVLMDRGDRISWTGDAFVSQGTLYAFASDYSIALQNLNVTSCADCCQGIASYCLLFVLSACEYFEATGDAAAFMYFWPVIVAKLEEGYRRYNAPFPLHSMRFVGWDDRTGGWAAPMAVVAGDAANLAKLHCTPSVAFPPSQAAALPMTRRPKLCGSTSSWPSAAGTPLPPPPRR